MNRLTWIMTLCVAAAAAPLHADATMFNVRVRFGDGSTGGWEVAINDQAGYFPADDTANAITWTSGQTYPFELAYSSDTGTASFTIAGQTVTSTNPAYIGVGPSVVDLVAYNSFKAGDVVLGELVLDGSPVSPTSWQAGQGWLDAVYDDGTSPLDELLLSGELTFTFPPANPRGIKQEGLKAEFYLGDPAPVTGIVPETTTIVLLLSGTLAAFGRPMKRRVAGG